VDRSRWDFELGQPGVANRERQYYTDSDRNAAHDGQGNLVITARRENPGDRWCHYGPCEYTSARLITARTFAQRYGRFEARLKVPAGQGSWPAFWLLGTDMPRVGWPQSGEIDVMETVGRQPATVHGTVHGPGYSGSRGVLRSHSAARPLAEDFHVYRVDWGPNQIVWYLDDVEYARVTPADVRGNRWVFDRPFYLLLNLAVGGVWPGNPDASTPFPMSLHVDYVRVWPHPPPATAPSPPPAPPPPAPVAETPPVVLPRTVPIAWAAGAVYTEGDVVAFAGLRYRVLRAHMSRVGREPPHQPDLFAPA
jgi:beta-glucanase (GH16 family)